MDENENLDIKSMSIEQINDIFSDIIEFPAEDSILISVVCTVSCGRASVYYK